MNNKLFNEIKRNMEERTRNSGACFTVISAIDCNRNVKYFIENIKTHGILPHSYNTLDDIIKEYDLNV